MVEPNLVVGRTSLTGRWTKRLARRRTRPRRVTADDPNGTQVSTANNSILRRHRPGRHDPRRADAPRRRRRRRLPTAASGTKARGRSPGRSKWCPARRKRSHYKLRVNNPANRVSVFKNKVEDQDAPACPARCRRADRPPRPRHAGYESKADRRCELNDAALEKTVEAPKGTTIGSRSPTHCTLILPPGHHLLRHDGRGHAAERRRIRRTDRASPVRRAAPAVGTARHRADTRQAVAGGGELLGWYFGKVEPTPVNANGDDHLQSPHRQGTRTGGKKVVRRRKTAELRRSASTTKPKRELTNTPTEPPVRGNFSQQNERTERRRSKFNEPKLDDRQGGHRRPRSAPATQPGDTTPTR